jgi:hypothetical protein
VKQTKEKGYIEIELKGPPGNSNIVIRRDLTQGSKSSTYTIDGKRASGGDVNTRIAQLNIQVSNLWYANYCRRPINLSNSIGVPSYPRIGLQNLHVCHLNSF